MNDFYEVVVPAITVSFIFLIIFGFFAFMRYLRYKETIALAERGLLRPSRRQRNSGRNMFKWGVLILSVGIGLFCTLTPLAAMTGEPEAAVIGIILGALPASFGIGLILVDRYTRKEEEGDADVQITLEDDPIPPHKVQE